MEKKRPPGDVRKPTVEAYADHADGLKEATGIDELRKAMESKTLPLNTHDGEKRDDIPLDALELVVSSVEELKGRSTECPLSFATAYKETKLTESTYMLVGE